MKSREKIRSRRIYLPDGSEYSINDDQQSADPTVRTATWPHQLQQPGEIIEIVSDTHDLTRAIFFRWADGASSLHPKLERGGKIFTPPILPSDLLLAPSLPTGLRECGTPAELVIDLLALVPRFLDLTCDQALVVATFMVASWFPDCFEAVPYLWVTGPLGSGKSKLLRFLKCTCRKGLMVGDVRGAAIYQLVASWGPTLIIDEFEQAAGGTNNEILRQLRSGTQPDAPTVRKGVPFATFGLKAMSSRQPPLDAALASRCLVVSMLPTDKETTPLDRPAMESIAAEYQGKGLAIRVRYLEQVKNFRISPDRLLGMTPRMNQICRALATPLLGAEPLTSELLKVLAGQDAQGVVDRSLEPEWLTLEALFRLCHEQRRGHPICQILVGAVAAEINSFLEFRGEDVVFTARKIGSVLNSLGVPKEKLGNLGRGMRVDSNFKRKVHDLARRFGIDRLTLCSPEAPEYGYGGAPCALCDEFGLGAGLRYASLRTRQPKKPASSRGSLLAKRDPETEYAKRQE